ncbi:hypothetical protein CHS0354_007718 [Potamilus streckersoni]|uniref:Uncharacterized protein n=1 Tax=Potamilus streckersoni TaxID=2493646 RepID=A0AAE0SIP3_9BIVA|nr:hypothetical protein CHS0354_007718 [Potamilus streckersoni]
MPDDAHQQPDSMHTGRGQHPYSNSSKEMVPVYITASTQIEEISTRGCGTQSGDQPMFSIQNLVNDPRASICIPD